CYMSIGEAEDYRYYWQEGWNTVPPAWLVEENPEWRGNYKVRYWEPEWQNLVVGDTASYLEKILIAGFDGVYLDLIDAFEYFEEEQ
ncbi:MAG: endo alpha-1,4 polygalactosaminidase, partial [Candidatus Bipolaricaulota bacterium]|nr:endo alpha-1,4 polygalactosaminidase [Candidatus Bipolaricaulota bacterium]